MTPTCYHPRMAATTLRLPEALKTEADALAARLGISLNALAAVALRDYLDGRSATARSALRSLDVPAPVAAAMPSPRAAPSPRPKSIKAPASRNDPCPCGATNTQGYPIKWKRCHGAVKPA